MLQTKRFGWLPDLPDHRDFFYHQTIASSDAKATAIPASIDLRPDDAPIYDQMDVGSCVGNSTAGDMQFIRRKEKLPDFVPSRLMIYYDARALEGSTGSDSGAFIRDAFKTLLSQGACDETLWPYSDDPSVVTAKPSDAAYAAAKLDRAFTYYRVTPTLDLMKLCLAAGFPFVFGFTVYQSFMNVGPDGVVPMPGANEQSVGGHAVGCVGYSDASRIIVGRNSWGSNWGDKGYFYMSYDYIANPNLCDDFWTVRLVGG